MNVDNPYSTFTWLAGLETFRCLSPHNLHAWRVMLPLDDDVFHKLKLNLSEDEHIKANQFYAANDKIRYIITRGILRELLSRYLNIRPHHIQFSYNLYGKPYLQNNLEFNITHSNHCIMLAFSMNIPIGVDIEFCKNDFNPLLIAQDFFSTNEYDKLLSLPPEMRHLAFYRCWTRKEAIIKAMGKGLAFPLSKLDVTLLPAEKPKLIKLETNDIDSGGWHLIEIKPHLNYIGAIATSGEINSVSYYDWNCLKIEVQTL